MSIWRISLLFRFSLFRQVSTAKNRRRRRRETRQYIGADTKEGEKKVEEVDFWIGYRKEVERTGGFLVSLLFSLQGRIRPRYLSVARAWSSVCGPRTGIRCLKPGFLLRIGKKPFLAFYSTMHAHVYGKSHFNRI